MGGVVCALDGRTLARDREIVRNFTSASEAPLLPSPIRKALSTLTTHQVRYLLMGGQACVLYGAAEFSRDVTAWLRVTGFSETLRCFRRSDECRGELMIENVVELRVAIRQLRIMEKALNSMREELQSANPWLFAVAAPAYVCRIAGIQNAIAHYFGTHPADVSLILPRPEDPEIGVGNKPEKKHSSRPISCQ